MGRGPYGVSDWLDGRGVNPLEALVDFISSYPQPAPRGVPKYEWEPPRVAEKVKDRVGRLEALGNAVNPLQVLPIIYAIKVIDDWLKAGDRH
jgi:DNA (cytosine-5)-methyltransferase 1